MTPSILIVPDRYKASVLYSQIPDTGAADFSVVRNTTAYRTNASGLLESMAVNVPRLDFPIGSGCPALLIEPAATNQIRNNSMQGAVTGIPGTLPTNWTENLRGLSREVIGTGAENGVDYIDIRLFGTRTSPSALFIGFEARNFIVASFGQNWAASSYFKVINNPNNISGFLFQIFERTGTVQNGSTDLDVTNFSTLQRAVLTRNVSNVLSDRVDLYFSFNSVPLGVSVDFTVRIGWPQMELGSVATSPIRTTTAAATRNADVISKTGVSGFIGQTEGTLYAEVDLTHIATKGFFDISANSGNFYRIRTAASGTWLFRYRTAAGTETTISDLSISNTSTGIFKIAFAYKDGDYASCVNGVLRTSSISGISPIGTLSNIELGLGPVSLNDRIRAAALYTTRLSNAQLQFLTTL